MSKYENPFYQTLYEQYNGKLKNYEGDGNVDVKEGLFKEFKGTKISDLKGLMHLNEEESKNFDFLNNDQDKVSNDYLKNLNIFSSSTTSEKGAKNSIMDYISSKYQAIVPENLNSVLKDVFKTDMKKSTNDCANIMENAFGKQELDLSNQDDRDSFITKFLKDKLPAIKDLPVIKNFFN